MSEPICRARIIFGDLTMGGHEPTPEERARLEGKQANGIPRGLTRCVVCGEWKGECLRRLVVRVQCQCDAKDRCRRCGASLYHHAIGSNYYVEAEDSVHHVPWFMGLKHERDCPQRHKAATSQPQPRSDSPPRPPLTQQRMLEIASTDLVKLTDFAHMELREYGYEARQRTEGVWAMFDVANQRYVSREEQQQLPAKVRELLEETRRLDIPDLE